MPLPCRALIPIGLATHGLQAINCVNRLASKREQHLLGQASSRRSWIAIGCIIALALLIQQVADAGGMLVIGLPIWILLFILLQVALTVTATWMARP